jgi:O-antigen ligase
MAEPYLSTIDYPAVYAPAQAEDSALSAAAFAGLCAFVFVMPWEESVPLWGGFVISRWILLLTGAILAMHILSTRRIRKLAPQHLMMLAFAAWAALTLFWTIDEPATIARAATYAQLLLAVWMIWELVTTDQRVLAVLKSYVAGATVMSIATILNFMNGTQAADLYAEQGKVKYHDDRYTMFGINENDMALMLALSVPIVIYLLSRRPSRALTLFCWLHLGVCMTALFLTGSRGGLISTAVAFTLFPLLYSKMASTQRAAFITMCAAGLACGVYFVPQDVWNRLLQTGTQISQGTLTHRTVVWDAGLEAFRDHPWLGVGAGAYGTAVVKAVDVRLVAHDTYLSVLVEMGVAGALLFATLLAALYATAWRLDSSERRFWLVLLATWSVGVCALSWDYHKPTWLLFGLLIAAACVRSD